MMDLSDEGLRDYLKAQLGQLDPLWSRSMTDSGIEAIGCAIRDATRRAAIEKCVHVVDDAGQNANGVEAVAVYEMCVAAIRALLNEPPDEKGPDHAE